MLWIFDASVSMRTIDDMFWNLITVYYTPYKEILFTQFVWTIDLNYAFKYVSKSI